MITSTSMMSHSHVLVLVLLPAVSLAEVTTFSECKQFFVGGISPTVLKDTKDNNHYQQICQCRLIESGKHKEKVYFYATLYDTKNKIPVYSAYIFNHADVKRVDRWYVEPQLERGKTECMGDEGEIQEDHRGKRQALNKDYEGSSEEGYDKSHLFPVYHSHTKDAMLATFTLTNAAPQDSTFNRGQWRVHEKEVAEMTRKKCETAYMVTGVIPDKGWIGNGVTVAKYYWRASCCVKGKGPVGSAGFWGPDNNGKVQGVDMKELEKFLSKNYGSDFSIFHEKCGQK